MEFVLVAINGLQKGRSFPLGEEACSIGRDPVNVIQIPEHSASRQHCSIRRQSPEIFLLTDLGSRNGTLRNGAPVTECMLNIGDEIQVGDSRFLFLAREPQWEAGDAIRFDDQDQPTETIFAMTVQPEEAIYLRLGQNETETAADPLSKGIALLWQLSSSMRLRSGLEELAEHLLLSLRDCLPAGNSAVMLFESGHDSPSWVYTEPAGSEEGAALPFPRRLIQKAVNERVALLSNREPGAGYGLSQSVLIAPLVAGAQVLGVLGIGHSAPATGFERTHLQLAAAVGALAGPAFLEALRFAKLEAENRRLQRELDIQHDMIGESAAALELYRFIAKAAPADSTVLICGESGTGKELAARALHRNSPRSSRPFVALNCAALSEHLVESELFGHEKGAFTGAITLKKGKLEVADGGTFFLDEVGELPLAVQAKLLRVLQERVLERVGGTRPIPVNVRLIAATNRNLQDMIGSGGFRQDLYYRLNVITMRMPPLRDRADDIPMLAEHFVRKFSAKVKRQVHGISPGARDLLSAYQWPGNIRELENVIERAVVIGAEDLIMIEDLPEELLDSAGEPRQGGVGFHGAVRQAKRNLILDAMCQAEGNYTEAAQVLELNPTYLHRLIGNLNLKTDIKRMLSTLASKDSKAG
jgi:transcriptional regulator with GAF, ATPase, and Fis domain